jgi:hypothetical protein
VQTAARADAGVCHAQDSPGVLSNRTTPGDRCRASAALVCAAGPRACPPPGSGRVRSRPLLPDDRRVARTVAGGFRAGVDAVAHCPAAIHEGFQEVDAPLEGPQLALPPLRPHRAVCRPRSVDRRDRPGPDGHLLGVNQVRNQLPSDSHHRTGRPAAGTRLRVALDGGRLGAVHCIFRLVPRTPPQASGAPSRGDNERAGRRRGGDRPGPRLRDAHRVDPPAAAVLSAVSPASPARPPRRWAVRTALTVGVFLMGLLAVTGVELVKGSTLARGETGTSVGRVVDPRPVSADTTESTETAESTGTALTQEVLQLERPVTAGYHGRPGAVLRGAVRGAARSARRRHDGGDEREVYGRGSWWRRCETRERPLSARSGGRAVARSTRRPACGCREPCHAS